MGIPCVGGKVSLYNETASGPIKPTPLIGVLGISDRPPTQQRIDAGDILIIVGKTYDEIGGSEYLEFIYEHMGERCPGVDFEASRNNAAAVLDVTSSCNSIHDCSKGGLAIAIAELCMRSGTGCRISLDGIPGPGILTDRLLFSESHSRYLLAVNPAESGKVGSILEKHGASFECIGTFGGDAITFTRDSKECVNLRVDKAQETWSNSLEGLLHG